MVDDWFMFMYDQCDSDRFNFSLFVHSRVSQLPGIELFLCPSMTGSIYRRTVSARSTGSG